jgi:hypothetical protein
MTPNIAPSPMHAKDWIPIFVIMLPLRSSSDLV